MLGEAADSSSSSSGGAVAGCDGHVASLPVGAARAAESKKKCEGYELRDPLGRRIGRVVELFVGGEGKPKYVRVRVGPLGLRRSFLLPVEAVAEDEERRTLVLL